IIPDLANMGQNSSGLILEPGKLTEIGTAHFATGGGVANVGQTLIKLGVSTSLMANVGRDPFGDVVRTMLRSHNRQAAETIRTVDDAATAYTLIFSSATVDRSFLHHAGCNDSFGADDIDLAVVAGAKIFYLGYPPLMRRFYQDEGRELAALFQRIKELGVTTALDMAMPDPNSDAGSVNWQALLERTLPYVDIFMPNIEEVLSMLNPRAYEGGTWRAQGAPASFYGALSQELLDFGAGVVGLKLGENGCYLRTAGADRLMRLGQARPESLGNWSDRELWVPILPVRVGGTTGAGDATFAGFLAALLKGLDPAGAISVATAVGACSVEAPDATSGVRSWGETLTRLQGRWQRATTKLRDKSWQPYQHGTFRGPNDGIHVEGGLFDEA
ncbi:MAG: carbohydrate kinase family protein, partial [Deinococcota bacterium]